MRATTNYAALKHREYEFTALEDGNLQKPSIKSGNTHKHQSMPNPDLANQSLRGVPKAYSYHARYDESATDTLNTPAVVSTAFAAAPQISSTNLKDQIVAMINNWMEDATTRLLNAAFNTVEAFSDEAQAILDGYAALKDLYSDFQNVTQDGIDSLPSAFGIRELAQQIYDTLTGPVDNLFASVDDSLGLKTLELVADKDRLMPLLDRVSQAAGHFNNNPVALFKSIFGPINAIFEGALDGSRQDEMPYGEYNIMQDPEALFSYLEELTVIPLLMNSPGGVSNTDVTDLLFMQDPEIVPDIMAPRLNGTDNYANEDWFYINGVAMDEELATNNALQFSDMFGRPIDLIHNPVDSFPVDLLECGVDKSKIADSTVVQKTTEAIAAALKNPDKDKVVTLAYSQGTIITSSVLDNLNQMVDNGDLSVDELAKLEVYTFANCADQMISRKYEDGPNAGEDIVHMEHFANGQDLVPHLGILSEDEDGKMVPDTDDFSGNIYVRDDGWGHVLGECYLYNMEDAAEQAEWGDMSTSRLFSSYFGG